MKKSKTVCVFCSSNTNIGLKIIKETYSLGNKLAEAEFDIVWGGCDMGCMGAIARGVQNGKGKVIGVITKHFIDKGNAFTDADELIVVKDLRERKQVMQEKADAFIVLPGGFGTLDELFDILATQIINQKSGKKIFPIVIVNLDGFFNDLKIFVNQLYVKKFANEEYKEIYRFVDKLDEGITFVNEYLGKNNE